MEGNLIREKDFMGKRSSWSYEAKSKGIRRKMKRNRWKQIRRNFKSVINGSDEENDFYDYDLSKRR